MKQFHYQALDPQGERVSGKLEALDEADVLVQLGAEGLTPVSVRQQQSVLARLLSMEVQFGASLSAEERIYLLRDTSTFLAAGISLDKALDMVASSGSSDTVKLLLENVRKNVRAGRDFAEALGNVGDTGISSAIIARIGLSEASGNLAPTLLQIAIDEERSHNFGIRVRDTLTYPVILMVAVIVVLMLVVLFVMPQFEPVFSSTGGDLPWLTKAVMAFGKTVASTWWILLLIVFGLSGWLMISLRDEKRSQKIHAWLASRVLWQQLVLPGDHVRFSRTLGSALAGGQPLDQALEGAAASVRNLALRGNCAAMLRPVREGGSLAMQMQDSVFPTVLIQMVAAGEETGNLAGLLLSAADHMEKKYEARLKKFLTLLGPILTLVSGLIVALLVGSIVMGMMQINTIGGI